MNDPHADLLTEALRRLPSPELDDALAGRVLVRAKAYLAPAASEGSAGLRLTLAGALVPGLLAAVALDHVAETMKAVDAVYGAAVPRAARPSEGE